MRDGGQKKAPPRFPREGLRAARGWATKGCRCHAPSGASPFEVSLHVTRKGVARRRLPIVSSSSGEWQHHRGQRVCAAEQVAR
jgi:hypothetical protein